MPLPMKPYGQFEQDATSEPNTSDAKQVVRESQPPLFTQGLLKESKPGLGVRVTSGRENGLGSFEFVKIDRAPRVCERDGRLKSRKLE